MSKKMILLTAESKNWAPTQLKETAEKHGFEVEVINPDECYVSLAGESYISYNGTKFMGADFCLPRLSEEHLDYKCSIINHIEEMGVKVLNNGESLKIASNKIETQIKLNAAKIKTPATALFTNADQLEHAVESIGGKFPVIIKTIFGTHGVGVIRADSSASLKSIAQQMAKSKTEFMLQEFIEHEESARILMLGDKCLAAVMRGIPKGDFRSNAHQGAELKGYKPSEKELDAVKKSCEAIGINFAAVDYILKDGEVIVLEVNGSPGFEKMQKVVDITIAEEVIKFCESMMSDKIEVNGDNKQVDVKDDDDDDFNIDINGSHDQVEVEAQGDAKADIPSGPVEEEEEEEDTSKKVVDVDKEKQKDKVVDVDKDVDKEIHPNDSVIDAELFDKEHENIIGTITSVKINHFNDDEPIEARVDTGANTSSIAGEDIKVDGNSVKFKFNNTMYKFHLLRLAKIKQADSDKIAERPVIRVDIMINGIQLKNIEMNVNTRSHMKYPILLGRSALSQAAILINPAANNIDAHKVHVTSVKD